MNVVSSIDPANFLEAVQPLLKSRDLQGLCTLLRTRWTPREITDLLSCSQCDVRKVAALALSLVGGRKCICDLARQLRDPDPVVNQMAEHALWSIWFRLGEPAAHKKLLAGLESLNNRDLETAEQHFAQAIELDSKFAEAYNQRAIVHYLREEFRASIDDCHRAVELMPDHFGAWAGLGHCHAHLGENDQAIKHYKHALEINPHLDCLRQAVDELKGTGG